MTAAPRMLRRIRNGTSCDVVVSTACQRTIRTRLSGGGQAQTWSNWRMTDSTTGTATALPVSLRTVVVGMSIS